MNALYYKAEQMESAPQRNKFWRWLKKTARWQDPVVVGVLLMGAAIFMGLTFAHLTWERQMAVVIPLVQELNDTALQLTDAHLWLEESLIGDTTVDIEAVNQTFEAANRSTEAAYKLAMKYPDSKLGQKLGEDLDSLGSKIKGLKQYARDRWTGADADNIPGTATDQQFDARFKEIIGDLYAMLRQAHGLLDDASRVHTGVYHSILVLFVSVLGVTTVILSFYQGSKRRAEEALALSNERYALVAESANDGLWDWDLTTDSVFYSSRWIGNLSLGELANSPSPQTWLDRIHQADRTLFEMTLRRHLDGVSPLFSCEHRLRDGHGQYRWMLARGIALLDAADRPVRIVGSLSDIDERKRLEVELSHRVLHDSLTNLPNRVLIKDRLQKAIDRYRRDTRQPYAVLFVDLDNFQRINDSLGHGHGDQLLTIVSGRLREVVREQDTVSRMGGDEFVLLLEDCGQGVPETIAGRINSALNSPIFIGDKEILVTASIGILLGSKNYTNAENCLRDADAAMYQAKAQGKAQAVYFDSSIRESLTDKLDLEAEIRRGLKAGEFELFYQPIHSLRENRLIGFEGLARWRHPERGILSPAEFIALAEETQLIVSLGMELLNRGCRQMNALCGRLKAGQTISLAINVSSRQFSHDGFFTDVQEAMRDAGIISSDQCSLTLEITESIMMDRSERNIALCHALRDLGVKLSVDDFGTGYSSLSYLHRFPVNSIKIDRTFVERIVEDSHSESIVKSVVSLAEVTGSSVVAEGIETEAQRVRCAEIGCHFGQGYLFGKPIPAIEAEAYLEQYQD